MTLPPGDPRHGTRGGYGNHRCRCEACTKANRDKSREYNHRTGRTRPWDEYVAGLPPRTHGIRATYVDGCRCPACTQAERDYKRDLRARARAVDSLPQAYESWREGLIEADDLTRVAAHVIGEALAAWRTTARIPAVGPETPSRGPSA